jgi:hypothetical protein
MLRTLAPAAFGLALITLTACQQGGHHGGARPAPDLAGAFARTYGARVADAFPAAQRAAVASCIGQALANGIPLGDQFLIYDQITAGQTTPQSEAAMKRWLAGPVITGPQPKAYNQSGGTGGDPAAARIEGNVTQFCAAYRDRLMKAGYIAGISGQGGPSGGYSHGK